MPANSRLKLIKNSDRIVREHSDLYKVYPINTTLSGYIATTIIVTKSTYIVSFLNHRSKKHTRY